MDLGETVARWPVLRQLRGPDRLGRGPAAQSRHSLELTPRTASADKVVKSICPFCAVGCGQQVYWPTGPSARCPRLSAWPLPPSWNPSSLR